MLLIADEVITRFCRTGRWFGLHHWQVEPDIMTAELVVVRPSALM